METKGLNLTNILNLPRNIKILSMILIDSCLCCLSVWFAFYLRLGNFFTPIEWMLVPMFILTIISLIVFWYLGVYKDVLRFFDKYNISKLFLAIVIYSIFVLTIIMIFSFDHVPRTIGFIQPILYFLSLYIVRSIFSYALNHQQIDYIKKKNAALIYGAGSAGIQLMNSLNKQNFNLEGFLDDDDRLNGRYLNGKKIYNIKDLKELITHKNIDQVLLAIPSLSRNERNKIFKNISSYSVSVKTLPTLSDLAGDIVQPTDIQEPNVEDLLGREEVEPNKDLMIKNIFNKIVLISGAGGSIGSELSRQIIKLRPRKLILLENNEFALYKIFSDLEGIKKNNSKLQKTQILSILGSVNDQDFIDQTIKNWKPDTIFHSAAYKHVSLVNQNIIEGVKNNVFGTIKILKSSIFSKVSNFVFISTDKAVNPKNIMGASKRLSEMYIQAINKSNNYNKKIIDLTIVRFGNVLDSSGSVIPIFKKQIRNGGPVTLSDLNVTRYFMTIPEASSLVIQASGMIKNDEIFVLDMGQPVKILDLATKMINFSGFRVKDKLNPYGDIEIVIKGLFPGEKLHEDLLIGNDPISTEHPKILKVKDAVIELDELEKKLDQLKLLIDQRNESKIIDFFNNFSDEFNLETENFASNLVNKNIN
jgi:FlaA1/EpsC-like NDP-sugar epimerase